MSSVNVELQSPPTPPRSEPDVAAGRKQVPDVAYSAGAILLLLVVWYLISHSSFVKPGYVPTPEELGTTFLDLVKNGYQGQPLYNHIGISLFRTLTGFLLGVVVGVPIGLLSGYSRRAGAMISPIMALNVSEACGHLR